MDSNTVGIGQNQRVPVSSSTFIKRTGRRITRVPSAFVRHMTRAVASRLEVRLLHLALANPRFATLYYFVADRSFDREIHAVLHGQMAHRDRSHSSADEAARFTLRRNIHRLEKGLLMRPRRSVFAQEYVEETTQAFADVISVSTGHMRPDGRFETDPLLQWADDVLSEYFNVVSDTEIVTRCLKAFHAARASLNGSVECAPNEQRRIPYRRAVDPLSITIDDMSALVRRRRSVRWFKQRPVPREMIDRALEVALQSPSACNRQPFVFHVFDDPDLVQKVCDIPMGTKGYGHNIPAVAVIVGRQRAYFSERDRHLIYIDGSLAAMGFMYALEVQGLSSCPINWPDIEDKERKMSDLLGLAPDERPIMLVAIGYPDPDGLVAYSQKKPLDEARTFNHASSSARTIK